MLKYSRGKHPHNMKKQNKVILVQVIIFVIAWYLFVGGSIVVYKSINKLIKTSEEVKVEVVDQLNHKQRVWLNALEWCESRGNNKAINKVDRDGTPSYYAFQFKPGTFRDMGVKYGLVEPNLSNTEVLTKMEDYTLTLAIMEKMVLDPTITDKQWRKQLFPGCTAKLGSPVHLST